MSESWSDRFLAGGFLLLLLLLAQPGQAQQRAAREKLSSERQQIEEQIRLSNQLLEETHYQRDKSLAELALLNKQIALREALVRSLNEELKAITREIDGLNEVICGMEEDIEEVKYAYARTAQATYKSFSEENILLALLSAESLAQAYYRTLYYQQFTRFRHTQLERLKKSRIFLTQKSLELRQTLKERESLLRNKSAELAKLKTSKSEQNSLFFALKDKESQYRKRLDQQRRALKALIRRMDASYGTKVAAKNNETGRSFARLKGALPWPIASGNGLVVGKFGETEDAFGNRITNDGIFIRTRPGEVVRAVYEGKVTGVQKVPLSGTMVIIEHGVYRTVYANMESVEVKPGDQINSGDEIGTVRTDERTEESIFNFMVYRSPDVFENPQKWLK